MFYWIIWMRGFSTMISLLKSLVFPSFLLFLLWFCIYTENKIFLYSYHRIYFRSVMLDFWMLEKHKYKSTKCGQFSKSLKTSQKLTALLYFWCFFCRYIPLSLQSRLQHHSYVVLLRKLVSPTRLFTCSKNQNSYDFLI